LPTETLTLELNRKHFQKIIVEWPDRIESIKQVSLVDTIDIMPNNVDAMDRVLQGIYEPTQTHKRFCDV
jgi:hypothetical protein